MERTVNSLVAETASKKISFRFQNSPFFQDKKIDNISSFKTNEITLGALLGKGEFCSVREISSIIPNGQGTCNPESYKMIPQEEDHQKMALKKAIIASNCSKKKGNKYAIKFLNETSCLIPSQFETAITDITAETKILAALDHPHIIKLHGFNKDELFTSDYFIILERLELTLHDVLDDWKRSSTKIPSKKMREKKIMSKLFERNAKEKKKYKMRSLANIINIAASVSSALSYLHNKR